MFVLRRLLSWGELSLFLGKFNLKDKMMLSTNSVKSMSEMMLTALLLGCATSSDKVSSSYVSPLMYQSLTCEQIKPELLRVNTQLVKVSGVQDQTATKDAVMMGVGLVVFWPALFFLAQGDDKQAEIANLKGQYEALESAAIQKNCNVAPELIAARTQREELQKKQQAEQQKAAISP